MKDIFHFLLHFQLAKTSSAGLENAKKQKASLRSPTLEAEIQGLGQFSTTFTSALLGAGLEVK